jgi:septal ring factor EnvC (AmiA/AmiB activator)
MWVVFGLMIGSVLVPFAQTKKETKEKLETKKKKLEEEIAYNKQLLEETRKNKKASVAQLNLLQSQISNRESLLDEINIGIDSLDRVIRDNGELLVKQEHNLRTLKDEYARIIYHAWKTKNSYDRLLFVFSAEDFNQAYRRLKYFQQFNEYRRNQAQQIVSVQEEVKVKMDELNNQKHEQVNLLAQNESEKERLAREKAEKDELLKKLKQKESAIKKTLEAKKIEAKKLQDKITAIIAAEIKKSSDKTNKTPTSNTNMKNILTPEEKVVSDNFASNMGKLPWPVASGVISEYFGEHDHPVLPGIKVKNNGINISTSKGAAARSVFNGTVVSIVVISDNNKAIIIRHGDYFTVYSGLQSISVSKNADVTIKQTIGTVATDPDEGKTELHFEVWLGKVLQNPINWLAPR